MVPSCTPAGIKLILRQLRRFLRINYVTICSVFRRVHRRSLMPCYCIPSATICSHTTAVTQSPHALHVPSLRFRHCNAQRCAEESAARPRSTAKNSLCRVTRCGRTNYKPQKPKPPNFLKKGIAKGVPRVVSLQWRQQKERTDSFPHTSRLSKS